MVWDFWVVEQPDWRTVRRSMEVGMAFATDLAASPSIFRVRALDLKMIASVSSVDPTGARGIAPSATKVYVDVERS